MTVVSLAALAALGLSAPQTAPPAGETWLRLTIERRGDIYIQLHTRQAPQTTRHIADLARTGFYDGQLVFRVDKEPRPYWIQMGDPLTRTRALNDPAIGTGGSGKQLAYEDSGFSNVRGAVGLATLPQQRDTGDSQFYILLGDATLLDGKYTVFGRVVRGMDVADRVERGDRIVSVRLLGPSPSPRAVR